MEILFNDIGSLPHHAKSPGFTLIIILSWHWELGEHIDFQHRKRGAIAFPAVLRRRSFGEDISHPGIGLRDIPSLSLSWKT